MEDNLRAEQSRAEQSRAEQSRAEQRENWIDIIKAVCMIFIIMSHLPYCPEILRKFFTPFFLTGFYFCSGYVMKPLPMTNLIKKKAKTILWPWLVFSFIEIIMNSLFGSREITFMENLFYNLLQIKGFHESLWFFPNLFMSFILIDILILKFKKNRLFVISFGIMIVSRIYGMIMPDNLLPWKSVCLPWHIHNIGTTAFFMIVGYLYKKYLINEKIKKFIPVLIAGFSLIYIIEIYIFRDYEGIGIWKYPELFIWLIVMMTGLFMIVYISQIKILNKSHALLYIGKNTLLYYALHQNLCRIIDHIVNRWNFIYAVSQTITGKWLYTIFFAVFIIMILIIPIEIIKRKMRFLIKFEFR